MNILHALHEAIGYFGLLILAGIIGIQVAAYGMMLLAVILWPFSGKSRRDYNGPFNHGETGKWPYNTLGNAVFIVTIGLVWVWLILKPN